MTRNNFKSAKQQLGLSMISWIFVLMILAFCGIFLFRVVPMFSENLYVKSALKSLADGGESVKDMSDIEIKRKLANFYQVNNVRSAGPQNIEIDRKSDKLLIKIDYEMRETLFLNIDVVTSFQNHLDANNPTLCCDPVEEKIVRQKY